MVNSHTSVSQMIEKAWRGKLGNQHKYCVITMLTVGSMVRCRHRWPRATMVQSNYNLLTSSRQNWNKCL